MHYLSTKIKLNKGIALVAVLLIVALVSVIATSMTQTNLIEIRRSGNIYDYQQARHYLIAAEQLAISQFEGNKRDIKRDDLGQFWASDALMFPVERGNLSGEIIDLNRCFNINSLVKEKEDRSLVAGKDNTSYNAYISLLSILELPTQLVDSLIDWLDTNTDEISYDGAEDNYYELLIKPYKSANTLISDISELRLIKGYTAEVYNKLSPFICALPKADYLKININTIMQAEILTMLIPELSLNNAREIIDTREPEGFKSQEDFFALAQFSGININNSVKSILQLDSDYFILKAKAEIGKSRSYLTSLLQQQGSKQVKVIWRHFKKHPAPFPKENERKTLTKGTIVE
ncbi:MAG: type II secretion system minor pseudopilin GspK [Gammaproteobacteria bacterium]|nr:type II secretion system minor pseudopilin GspK [Gammaproteobacteria bacterium]